MPAQWLGIREGLRANIQCGRIARVRAAAHEVGAPAIVARPALRAAWAAARVVGNSEMVIPASHASLTCSGRVSS